LSHSQIKVENPHELLAGDSDLLYRVRVGMCGIVWNPHFNGSTEMANTGKGKAYPDFN